MSKQNRMPVFLKSTQKTENGKGSDSFEKNDKGRKTFDRNVRGDTEHVNPHMTKQKTEGKEHKTQVYIPFSPIFTRDCRDGLQVMNEPTSALDPIAEYDIYKSFATLTSNRTAIYISHRLTTTRFTDKIFVLSEGEICESGTHSELMQYI